MPPAKKKKLQCDSMNQIRHGRAPSVAVQTIVTKKIDRGIQNKPETKEKYVQTSQTTFVDKTKVDAQTQTTDYHSTHQSIFDSFDFDDLNILIDFLIDSVPGWHAIQTRVLGVFTYLALRLCKMKFSVAMDIFKKLNLLSMVYLKCY